MRYKHTLHKSIEYNKYLIPRRQKDGCPQGTFDGISTCFCEDHCRWNLCRLDRPPSDCPKVSRWRLNSEGTYYVAQITGNDLKKQTDFLLTIILDDN